MILKLFFESGETLQKEFVFFAEVQGLKQKSRSSREGEKTGEKTEPPFCTPWDPTLPHPSQISRQRLPEPGEALSETSKVQLFILQMRELSPEGLNDVYEVAQGVRKGISRACDLSV